MMLYLIRHGKTLANENRLYCGSTDIPLSPAGAAEAARYAGEYDIRADFYVTSGMSRTNDTMKLLFGEPRPAIRKDLAEMDFGDFEMKSYDELKGRASYARWIKDTRNNRCPGGESGMEVEIRVGRAIRGVISEYLPDRKDALCVLHGGVISIIMDGFFPGRMGFYDWQPKCCEGYAVAINKCGEATDWRHLP